MGYLVAFVAIILFILFLFFYDKLKNNYDEHIERKNYDFKYNNDPEFRRQQDYKEYLNGTIITKNNVWLDSDNDKEIIIIEKNKLSRNLSYHSGSIFDDTDYTLFKGTIDDPLMKTIIDIKKTQGEELKRCRECGNLIWAYIKKSDDTGWYFLKDYSNWNGFCSEKCEVKCKERDLEHYWRITNKPLTFFHYKEKEEYIKKFEYTNTFDCIPMYEYAQKQNFLCAICNGKMYHDWIKDGNNYLYHSIDHIMPVSKGGEHIEENVQVVHLLCNMVKWAGPNIKLSVKAEQFIKYEIIKNNKEYKEDLIRRYKEYLF